MRQLRPLLTITAALTCLAVGPQVAVVRPGIDVLLTDSVAVIAGRRVGLLTNQTGVDRSGTGDLERLLAARANVTAIFSPEHGYRGTLNRENIRDTVDSATGIPVYSLYGPTRAPTPAMLARVDVLLIDLQDIGARTYTYATTAVLAMKAVRAAGGRVRVVVLDRPNPIDGLHVQGPLLRAADTSFVGALMVPLRHGMTLGELARLANSGIGVPLTVIPAAGWRRGVWFDSTGLPWVNPSPNMPSLKSATLYPGIVLLEGTRVSVGRGTPMAFQLVGAPWMDPARVRAALGQTPGVGMSDTVFTPVAPSDGKYAGTAVRGFKLTVVDRERYDPVRFAVRLLTALWRIHRDSLRFDPKGFDRLAGSVTLRTAIERGADPDSIWRSWEGELDRFRRQRAPFLVYSR